MTTREEYHYIANGNFVKKVKVICQILKVKRLSESAILPKKADEGAAGYDLASPVDTSVEPRSRIVIPLDISIELPPGCYGRVAPRSGLAVKHGLDVGAGVIDQSYRGNVGVVLFNHSDNFFEIKKGDRIAQLILECYCNALVEESNELSETQRGTNGFGSSGVSSIAANNTPVETDEQKNIKRAFDNLSVWNEHSEVHIMAPVELD